jgi:hypothetical protein
LIEGALIHAASDENLRGRTVIAADGQAIGEIATLFSTAKLGASNR